MRGLPGSGGGLPDGVLRGTEVLSIPAASSFEAASLWFSVRRSFPGGFIFRLRAGGLVGAAPGCGLGCSERNRACTQAAPVRGGGAVSWLAEAASLERSVGFVPGGKRSSKGEHVRA